MSPPPVTLRDGLLHATLSWQTLVVLTVALVSAALVASATPLVLGACLASALAGFELLRPRFWQRLACERERALRTLPAAPEVLDPGLRAQVAALRQARYEAKQSLVRASPSLQRHVCASLQAQLAGLEGEAALLVREGESLASLLRSAPSPRSIEHELQELAVKLECADGEALRDEWRRTIDVRQRELETVRRLESERELVAATLSRVTATMRWLPLQLAELDLLEAHGGKGPRERVQEALSSLHSDLTATADSLRSLLDEAAEQQLLLDA